MNKTIISLIVILVVLVAGVIYLTREANDEVADVSATPTDSPALTATPVSTSLPQATPTPTPTPTPTATPKPSALTIKYTDNGYVPKSVEISAGTKVTFVNESSRLMWTASSPHPTHTDLPSFDSKQGTAMGQNYVFTFTQKGTWSYHNHIKASDTGTITVK